MRMKGRVAVAGAALSLTTVAGWAQIPGPPPRMQAPVLAGACLHEGYETAAERQRRDDALAMLRLTARLVGMSRGFPIFNQDLPGYPSWEELAAAGARLGRMDGGPMGRMARKVQWGSAEPLPGWRAHYVADRSGYALSLTDSRDKCGWTYFGDERGVVAQGYALDALDGVVPVDSQ